MRIEKKDFKFKENSLGCSDDKCRYRISSDFNLDKEFVEEINYDNLLVSNEQNYKSTNLFHFFVVGVSDKQLKEYFEEYLIDEYITHNFKTLEALEILKYIEKYEKHFEKICLGFARRLIKLLKDDYIKIVPEYKAFLSRLFSFRIDKLLHFILRGESNVISPKKIKRMISEIKEERNSLTNLGSKHEEKIALLLNFLDEYFIFSKRFYRNGFNTIFSQIKFVDDSKKQLTPRSWLIENIRKAFPRFYGIPLSNTLLTTFLFGDKPNAQGNYKLTKFLKSDRIDRRPHPYELFSIEYRVNGLTKNDFLKNHIQVTEDQLSLLKKDVSYILFKFIFSNSYQSPYISQFTSSGIPVGKFYWIPEFFLIKTLYFYALEATYKDSMTLEELPSFFDLSRNFGGYLTDGIGFGVESIDKVKVKICSLKSNSNYERDLISEIIRFGESYYKRVDLLTSALGFSSYFQLSVHCFFEKNFGIKFYQDRPVQSITGSIHNYNDMAIRISSGFHFDGLALFTPEFRSKINIKQRWNGIVFEAHGSWHTDKNQFQERWDFSDEEWENRQFIDNELKPDICKRYGFVYIEIHEDLPEDKWLESMIEQFNEQTGVDLTEKIFPLLFS